MQFPWLIVAWETDGASLEMQYLAAQLQSSLKPRGSLHAFQCEKESISTLGKPCTTVSSVQARGWLRLGLRVLSLGWVGCWPQSCAASRCAQPLGCRALQRVDFLTALCLCEAPCRLRMGISSCGLLTLR